MDNFDLNQTAVARASGEDAGTVLGALLETPGIGLVHEYTMAKNPAPAAAPAAPGLGGSKPAARAKTQGAAAEKAETENTAGQVVPEYEIFRNDNNAVAFFLNRQASADLANDNGPFWFTVHEDKNIVAGNETGQAFFADVAEDIVSIARERGVILLIEFENQQPIRCTPCYFMDSAEQ